MRVSSWRSRQLSILRILSFLITLEFGQAYFLLDLQAREYELSLDIQNVEEVQLLLEEGELTAESALTLINLLEHPLDLNTATLGELYELPGVSYALGLEIIEWRAKHPFKEVRDLLQVPNIDRKLWTTLKPLVCVRKVAYGKLRSAIFTHNRQQGNPTRKNLEAYWQFREALLGPLAGGFLLTARNLATLHYAESLGGFVSEGFSTKLRLEQLYLQLELANMSLWLGSYLAGFGTKLTFANTLARYPYGIYANDLLLENNFTGRFKPKTGLWGVALSLGANDLRKASNANWGLSLFVGHSARELYQNDFWYGLDAWGEARAQGTRCPQIGAKLGHYVCAPTHRWQSKTVYPFLRGAAKHEYLTMDNLFKETLVGGNFRALWSKFNHVGITAYYARLHFNFQEVVPLGFSLNAPYPQRLNFGAVGIDTKLVFSEFVLLGETTLLDNQALALYLSALWSYKDSLELATRWWFYGPDFDNPYTHSFALREEELGLKTRNQRGVSFNALFKPLNYLTLSAYIEVIEHLYGHRFNEQGELSWLLLSKPRRGYRLLTKTVTKLSAKEDLTLLFRYLSRELVKETEQLTSEFLEYEPSLRQSYKLKLALTSSRLAPLLLQVGSSYVKQPEGLQQFFLRLKLPLFNRGELLSYVSYWLPRPVERGLVRRFAGYVDLRYRWFNCLWLGFRYTFYEQQRLLLTKSNLIHVGKLFLEIDF